MYVINANQHLNALNIQALCKSHASLDHMVWLQQQATSRRLHGLQAHYSAQSTYSVSSSRWTSGSLGRQEWHVRVRARERPAIQSEAANYYLLRLRQTKATAKRTDAVKFVRAWTSGICDCVITIGLTIQQARATTCPHTTQVAPPERIRSGVHHGEARLCSILQWQC